MQKTWGQMVDVVPATLRDAHAKAIADATRQQDEMENK